MADRSALFAAIGVYLFFLLGIAVFSYLRGRKAVQGGNADAEVNEHFLASSSFGTVVLFLTTFSTIVSGYTAFGIPTEAAFLGFISLRWLQGFVSIIIGYVVLAPRYRRIAIARNWQSPNDIIADRYNCNSLRLVGAFAQCFPMILYIAVQFISLEKMIGQISDFQISGEFGVWVLVIFIWICEVIGGFRGVSLTDAIQSGIMLVAFLGIPIVLQELYGGIIGFNEFPVCKNGKVPVNTTGSALTAGNCVSKLTPYFNFYPPGGASDVQKGGFTDFSPQLGELAINTCKGAIAAVPNLPEDHPCRGLVGLAVALDTNPASNYVPIGMLSFAIALCVSGLQVHWAQRIISAKSDLVVKKSLILTATCIMFAPIPGIMLGVSKSVLGGPSPEPDTLPFMVSLWFDSGGFLAFFSVVLAVSAVAAFMSTADSAAIGVANVLTVEVFQNLLTPNMSASTKIWVGKVISLSVLIIARLILYAGKDFDILTALNWQIGFGWAVAPTYALGLFAPDSVASAYALLAGMFVHYVLLFAFEFGVIENGTNIYMYSGIYCALVNFATTFIVNKLLPEGLKDDAGRGAKDGVVEAARIRFGGGKVDHLTSEKVKEIMADTTEPIGTLVGKFCVISTCILMVFSLPWWGKEGWDSTIDATDPDSLIVGLPFWAFNISVIAGVQFFLLLTALCLWKTPKMDTELKDMKIGE